MKEEMEEKEEREDSEAQAQSAPSETPLLAPRKLIDIITQLLEPSSGSLKSQKFLNSKWYPDSNNSERKRSHRKT